MTLKSARWPWRDLHRHAHPGAVHHSAGLHCLIACVLFSELPHAQMAAFFLDLALRWRGRKRAFKPCGRGLAALATEMAERAGSICALRALQIDRAK
jgi:hypothetical protein